MEIFQRCDGVKFKLRVPLLTVSFQATTRVLTGSGGHDAGNMNDRWQVPKTRKLNSQIAASGERLQCVFRVIGLGNRCFSAR